MPRTVTQLPYYRQIPCRPGCSCNRALAPCAVFPAHWKRTSSSSATSPDNASQSVDQISRGWHADGPTPTSARDHILYIWYITTVACRRPSPHGMCARDHTQQLLRVTPPLSCATWGNRRSPSCDPACKRMDNRQNMRRDLRLARRNVCVCV